MVQFTRGLLGGMQAVAFASRSLPRLLSLPPDLLQHILTTLTVYDIVRFKVASNATAQAGRVALTACTVGLAQITRKVASMAHAESEDEWRRWRKQARELFNAHAPSFVAGFEHWPRQLLIRRGVTVLSGVLRYTSRTRVPIGSDVGLQLLIALMEPWFAMDKAWELLPAALRRDGRPELDEIVPFLEAWTDVDSIARLVHCALGHVEGPLDFELAQLVRSILEHWAQSSMPKAVSVLLHVFELSLLERLCGARTREADARHRLCLWKGVQLAIAEVRLLSEIDLDRFDNFWSELHRMMKHESEWSVTVL